MLEEMDIIRTGCDHHSIYACSIWW